jgi:hypothetical protein
LAALFLVSPGVAVTTAGDAAAEQRVFLMEVRQVRTGDEYRVRMTAGGIPIGEVLTSGDPKAVDRFRRNAFFVYTKQEIDAQLAEIRAELDEARQVIAEQQRLIQKLSGRRPRRSGRCCARSGPAGRTG